MSVLVQDGGSVVHDAVPRHHPRARAQVGHGGGQLQVRRVVRRHADLDGARPLVHHLVDADLEHLVGAERPAAQHHAVVEVVGRTVETMML